jgi:hypothetical protein
VDSRALVGRTRELEVLDEVLRSSARGERTLLVLSGEAGIGKTRMLEELAQRVAAAGGISAWGRVWEVGLTPPFWPWIQVLGALDTPADPAPSLSSLKQPLDAAARLARFAEVTAFFCRRAAFGPVALLFDDLHAADASSLQLLEYIAPQLLGRPVLLALAARDTDATRETVAVLGRLQRGARRLPLARLGLGEVTALVGDRADAQRVFELSEGNPLYVEELLAAQASRGELRLPQLSSVRAVIRDRVARLPEATREALVAAAIVGREFRGQTIGDMLDLGNVGGVLEPASALGILNVTHPDRFRFSHALVAEALADELGASERAHLHLRAAQAIERRGVADSGALAHHLLEAGPLVAEAAVVAAERAAQQCLAQLAFEDAAALLERAIHALTLAAPDDLRRRANLLCARAEALQFAAQNASAAALCAEAAEIARALGATSGSSTAETAAKPQPADVELLARIALTRGLEFRFGRTDPLLVALLREALTHLAPEAIGLRAKLLARLAAAEQPALDPREPMQRAFEAIEIAARLSPRDRLEVMYVATAALVDYVDPHVLEGILLQVLELARGTNRSISVHTRLRLCFTALGRFDRADFDAAVQAFAAEAQALALPQWTRHLHMLHALTALLEGRFDDAERSAAESEAISTALGDSGAAWMLDVHRAIAAWIRTTTVDTRIRARLSDYPPGRAAIRAWFAVQEGALEATRAALAELGDRVVLDPDLASMVGSAVAFAGDASAAAKAYETLARRAGRAVLASMVGSAVMDLQDRVLLTLAARAGLWEAVDVHAERALAIANTLGSPVWVARVQADLADALDRRKRDDDQVRARELRNAALATAERLGMPGLLERCRAGTKAVRAAEQGGPLTLSPHGELWIVSGFGEQVHVKNSRGLQMIARLVEQPRNALHVLDLAGGAGAIDGGDLGPALDAKARNEYRARLNALVAAREEADASGDYGQTERINHELELLTAELERAFGLGGRERKIGAASERARSNVQRRISHGIEQVRAGSAKLGEHLAATIRTGTYCSYEPA